MSHTPNFDKALDVILKDLKPHKRTCQQCGGDFEIFKEDIEFYHMLRVPPPTFCPECRKQRRFVFSNNMMFYKRPCDAPGHTEWMISLFPENIPHKVFDHHYWWGDEWDPMRYGIKWDSSLPFFEQFRGLFYRVPLIQSNRDPRSEASEYTAYGLELKNCYYVFGGIKSEDIWYGNWPINSRDCMDVFIAWNSESCYEIVASKDNHNCAYIYFSDGCMDSRFLYDCKNCSYCFGCVNLRNKKYHFFNQPLTKEAYEQKMREMRVGSRSELLRLQREFWTFVGKNFRRATRNENVVHATGTLLRNCKNCFMCFWVESGENLRYVDYSLPIKDSMDITIAGAGGGMERMYEIVNAATYDIKFSHYVRQSSHSVEYSINCLNCEHCFGCVGLRNKKFCIFNRQYSEDEYWKLADETKTRMLERGEYGEFFPISMSPYPYNASLAQLEFPRTKTEVEGLGGYWAEPPISLDGVDPQTILRAPERLPDDIKDVDDGILEKVIVCETTGKPFRIIKQELEFYRKHDLPLPTKHPYQRLIERFAMKTPFRLWQYPCAKCGKETYTSYDPALKLTVYCEECYKRKVI
ncbi:MAG: hypothetical protein A3C07_03690 [Candidatus Sungbacteria bacterium RIFCSPHIGHO2_02_FULL_47_11]|uniref:Zinc-binding domain-containing protein n=1 Tax=Candidatus Sungbacteria bacterium RIFCSPHIGHO2_02_FULL_47_11 TaxID=1802270 RepID=A0A1G2KP76_9BACT|nr:MAG: hypothetical protein A3C07_03690 [Candidatus Sungbacteria bacterium RIFCSPHIGHO2_02_FULL_47_11]